MDCVLLGFGALELNVVYPALAATYTLLCARTHFRRTLLLFIPSAVFTVIHRAVQPAGDVCVHDALRCRHLQHVLAYLVWAPARTLALATGLIWCRWLPSLWGSLFKLRPIGNRP